MQIRVSLKVFAISNNVCGVVMTRRVVMRGFYRRDLCWKEISSLQGQGAGVLEANLLRGQLSESSIQSCLVRIMK
jgi:hypothetical protein